MTMLATDGAIPTRRRAMSRPDDLDTELLEALRSEDPSAAEYLVDRYGDRAWHRELEVP
jgi:hypothetical protein